MQDSEHHDGARDTRWRDDRMTGRRSHGRLSALNGVVHQGSPSLLPVACRTAGVSRSSAITAPSSLMTPSDFSQRRIGLGCRLVPPVAVAVRSPRDLPCSTRHLVCVLSLIPRRSPPLLVSSDFAAGAAFARSEGARPPRLCYGATCRFTHVGPADLLHPGFDGDLAVPFAPPEELRVSTTFHMVSLLPLTGGVPLSRRTQSPGHALDASAERWRASQSIIGRVEAEKEASSR